MLRRIWRGMQLGIYWALETTLVTQMNTQDELRKVFLPLVLVAALFAAAAPRAAGQPISLSAVSKTLAQWGEAYAASESMLQMGN